MSKVKYQIILSSTFTDLKDERLQISKAILDMGHIPSGMELFPAVDDDQLTYIKRVIDECDYYVLVIGGRYGSVDEDGVSYTEREFEYAIQTGKFVLAFIHSNIKLIPSGNVEMDSSKRAALEKFSDKAKSGRLVKFWSTPNELTSHAIIALNHAFSASPQIGWVRADAVPSDATLSTITALKEQNEKLTRQVKSMATGPSTPPDAAGLTDAVELRYTFLSSSQARRGGKWSTTYGEVFKAVANGFVVGHTPVQARIKLAKHIEDIFPTQSSVLMNEHDVDAIMLQFVVIGLMSTNVAAAKDGSWHEFYTLNQKGKTTYLANSYARKPDPSE